MLKKVLLFFAIIVNLFANEYIKKADDLQTYKKTEWLLLLHYKDGESVITDTRFFLSPNGKTNPSDELNATITSFYEGNGLCDFPARFDFLNKELNFKNLPKRDCKEYNEYINAIQPDSMTLIFPAGYINNPASMFGHTLIRLNKKDALKNDTTMNSFIVNYGADTGGETSGVIFAFRGVFGLYNGFFSILPYYKMINTYNNMENRDIWEYELNYTKNQVLYWTKHIWELQRGNTAYYFFKENCSYFLLETLNILHNKDLTTDFMTYTAPVDVVKVLYKENIIYAKKFRPSLQTQIISNEKYLTDEQIKSIKKNEIIPDYLTLETEYKLLQIKKIKGDIDDILYRKQVFEILKELNKNQKQNVEIITPESQEVGHKIAQMTIAGGKDYVFLKLRPGFNDLTDYDKGFDSQAEINFFNGEVKIFKDKFELSRFDFIKIKSLPLPTEFFSPLAFAVHLNTETRREDEVLNLDVEFGKTFGNKTFYLYGLFGGKVEYLRDSFFHKSEDAFLYGGIGDFGVMLNVFDTKTLIKYEINYFQQKEYNYNKITIENNIFINKDFYTYFEYGKSFYKEKNENDFKIGIKWSFI
ncbi:MAG: DUF4105 domain-containing protein [Rickettsiales bacterium]|nr:MAG: DUF4105 domain-containing protein [Rickettsiales bacterium]